MPKSVKATYFELVGASKLVSAFPVEGLSIRQAIAECLKELSGQLGMIIREALNELEIDTADAASKQKLRVDFMVLHIDQEIVALIDNSSELAAAQATIFKANKELGKIKVDTDNLAKSLDTASSILGEFEKLVKWVKA